MNERLRKVAALLVLGAIFLASLFLSQVLDAGIIFVAVATAVSVAISHLVWPTPPVVVALVMIVVATVLPISAMYVVANSGQETASLVEVLRLLVWWKNATPVVIAVAVAYFLKHLPVRSRVK